MGPFLTRPSAAYKDSFLEGLRESHAEGRWLRYDLHTISQDFEQFVQGILDQEDRSKTPPGRVPDSTFWLIDGGEYIGRLSVRHELSESLLKVGGHIGYDIRPSKRRRGYGKEILRLGLQEARKLGLDRVLVTCDSDNVGSRKIIEHNGGQLENEVFIEGEPVGKLRYWIAIT